YLAKKGNKVIATDVTKDSIRLVEENASLNNVKIHLVVSNLYEKIKGKYNCIIFIPPYFTFNSFSSIAFMFEKIFPVYFEVVIDSLLDRFFFNGKPSISRRKLIKKFLEGSYSHLSNNGCVFLMVFKSDISFLKKFSFISYEEIPLPFSAAIAIFKIRYCRSP
ncbi:MAG: methyltransferase, partial [Nanoarchaeota archaeon]